MTAKGYLLQYQKPIMLLDDVMSELDKKRREYILTKIQDCQIIITCTDIENFELLNKYKLFEVDNGKIKEVI